MELVGTETLRSCTARDTADLARLVTQLSRTAPPLTAQRLQGVLAASGTTVLVSRCPRSRIIGLAVLSLVVLPSGLKARIEDVVVDSEWRGRGVGKALTRHAIQIARQAGARYIDLTSAPTRVAARQLYQNLGFVRRESDTFRLDLEEPAARRRLSR